jgi:hypothetical protein
MIRYTTESATIYQVPQVKKERTEKQKENEANLRFQGFKELTPAELETWLANNQEPPPPKKGTYNGFVSKKTAREVTRRISNLLEIAPKAGRLVTFVTLTLPSTQKHPDNFVKRHLLGDFIQIIAKQYKVKTYIWKAETQKNGNIHFHLLVDSFLPNAADTSKRRQGPINAIWNNICKRYGYLENYRADRLRDYFAGKLTKDQIKWHKAFNFSVPNSTDVHQLKKTSKPEAYICKYVAKPEPGRRLVDGRIIGCSDKLKEVSNFWENENATQSGFDSYYALQNMANNNPKEVLKIYIDSENRMYKQFRPPNAHIIIEKYYYPPELWQKWAPPSHKTARYLHFRSTARTIYA